MSSILENLPLEMLHEIASQLAASDLIMLSASSQTLQHLLGASNKVVWFHKVRVTKPSQSSTGEKITLSVPDPACRSRYCRYVSPEVEDGSVINFNPEVNYRNVVLDYLRGKSSIAPSRCQLCFQTQANANVGCRGGFNSLDFKGTDGESKLKIYGCMGCKKDVVTALRPRQNNIWETDITDLPRRHAGYDRPRRRHRCGAFYLYRDVCLTSHIRRAVEKQHGDNTPFTDIIPTLRLKYQTREDSFLDDYISRVCSLLESNPDYTTESQIFTREKISELLKQQWEGIKKWWFEEDDYWKEKPPQGSSTWFEGHRYERWYRDSNAPKQNLFYVATNVKDLEDIREVYSSTWLDENASSMLAYLLTFDNFVSKSYIVRHKLTYGLDLPPLIQAIWESCSTRFMKEQEGRAGKCKWCKKSNSDYRTPLWYALHVYKAHKEVFLRDDAVGWRITGSKWDVMESVKGTEVDWPCFMTKGCTWNEEEKKMVLDKGVTKVALREVGSTAVIKEEAAAVTVGGRTRTRRTRSG